MLRNAFFSSQMAEPEFMQMGKAFVGFYYPEFSKDRSATSALAAVYTEQVIQLQDRTLLT